MGSGCGTVGRAVASEIRGPGFESSHRQLLLNIYLMLNVEKTKNKEKETENGPFFIRYCAFIEFYMVMFRCYALNYNIILKSCTGTPGLNTTELFNPASYIVLLSPNILKA